MTFTILQAKEILKSLDMSLRKRDGEFRVNFIGGKEETSYYTNDIMDAVETAKRMHEDGSR